MSTWVPALHAGTTKSWGVFLRSLSAVFSKEDLRRQKPQSKMNRSPFVYLPRSRGREERGHAIVPKNVRRMMNTVRKFAPADLLCVLGASGGETFEFLFITEFAEGWRLRNQDLLHPHDKSWLDFEQSLNDSFGLFTGNVLDVQARLFRFGEKVRIFEGIGEGFAQ
jgi:hypothetical protein